MRKLRILVLMHEELVPPDSIDGLSEQEIAPWKMEYDVIWSLHQLGHEVFPLGIKDELAPIRKAIKEIQPHIAFNLIMHFHDVGMYDAHVVSYLELLKTPYTGCNPRGLILAGDKALSKKILAYHRIPIPGFRVYPMGKKVMAPPKLRFPLIVKSVVEHASVGISQASIVHDEKHLIERVHFVHHNVGTDAIAEEYIDGRELTIGVVGNQRLQVFPIWELSFSNLPVGSAPIATEKVKWDHTYQKKVGVVTERASNLSEQKVKEIARMAKRIYKVLNLSGFARIDLRMTASGQVYVLEANPNPDLCFGEDFAESAEAAGLKYSRLIHKLINLGLSYKPAWKQQH